MDTFAHYWLSKAAAASLSNIGFSHCDRDALELFGHLTSAYLSRLANSLTDYAEHYGTENLSPETAFAKILCSNDDDSVHELVEYMRQVGAFTMAESSMPILPVRMQTDGENSPLVKNIAPQHPPATREVSRLAPIPSVLSPAEILRRLTHEARKRLDGRTESARAYFTSFVHMDAKELTLPSNFDGLDISVDNLASPIMAMCRSMGSFNERKLHGKTKRKGKELTPEALKAKAERRKERDRRKSIGKKCREWHVPPAPSHAPSLEQLPPFPKEEKFAGMANCRRLFNELLTKRRLSWPFLYRVETLDLPGYREMVKEPMDLPTIREKLEEAAYAGSADQFLSDLHLMLDNCMLYHSNELKIAHQLAKRLKAFVSTRWNTLAQSYGEDNQDEEEENSDSSSDSLISLIDGVEVRPSRLLKELGQPADTEGDDARLDTLIDFVQAKQLKCQEVLSRLQSKGRELLQLKTKRLDARLHNRPAPPIPRVLKNIKNELLQQGADQKERLIVRILKSNLQQNA